MGGLEIVLVGAGCYIMGTILGWNLRSMKESREEMRQLEREKAASTIRLAFAKESLKNHTKAFHPEDE